MNDRHEAGGSHEQANGPFIVSRTGLGQFVVHPASRPPNRTDPRFPTLAEAEACIDGFDDATGEAPDQPPVRPASAGDPDVEIVSQLANVDGSMVVTGVVSGYTLRATCGAGIVNVHFEDLDVVGLDPASPLAQALIDRWIQHLFDKGFTDRI